MAKSTASGSGLGTSFPAGVVMPFAGEVIPAGWELCDGRVVSRTAFRDLFNAIGTAWGEGDGSSTFHLPDMRGMTLRGNDPTNLRDEAGTRTVMNAGGNATGVGSYQDDAFQQHVHEVYQSGNFGTGQNANSEHHLSGSWNTRHQGGAPGYKTSSAETRMKNCCVNFIVKV